MERRGFFSRLLGSVAAMLGTRCAAAGDPDATPKNRFRFADGRQSRTIRFVETSLVVLGSSWRSGSLVTFDESELYDWAHDHDLQVDFPSILAWKRENGGKRYVSPARTAQPD